MENFLKPITPERLEKKGQSFYRIGKIGMLCGIAGLILQIISLGLVMIIEGAEEIVDFLCFDTEPSVFFVYPFWVISCLGILFGIFSVFLYFSGMKLFALGKIAGNTEIE